MDINKLVYTCKDNQLLLDNMLRNKEISIKEYQKVKMILEDEELCRISCFKYEQSRSTSDKLASTIKGIDGESLKKTTKEVLNDEKVNKFKPFLIASAVLLLLLCGFMFYKKVIYKTPFNLEENIVVTLNKGQYSGEADNTIFKLTTNAQYFNESSFYDDMKKDLKNLGLSDREADDFVPTYDATMYNHLLNLEFQPEYSKNSEIENGDEVKINFTYNKNYAKENKIKVSGLTKTVKVEGLREYITEENYKSVDTSSLQKACEEYLSENEISSRSKKFVSTKIEINKLGSCGFAFKEKNEEEEASQEGILYLEGNETTAYDDSYDRTFVREGYTYIQDGQLEFSAPSSSYFEGIIIKEEDYQETLKDDGYTVVKKAENIDLESNENENED